MNLKTLAAQLGVSVSTVSRVLSGHGDAFRIAKATQARILAAAEAADVRPNELARSLRRQSTLTLGLMIPDISNPFFAALARAVEQAARAAGYSVLLADSQESTEVEAAAASTLHRRQVDAIVVAPVGGEGTHLQALHTQGLPLVQVDRVLAGFAVGAVVADNFGGAENAVLYLAEAGHARIACLQGTAASTVNAERVRGYRAGLMKAGLHFRKQWLVGGDYTVEGGMAETQRLLTGRERPTALLALGNLLTLGAIQAARKQNVLLPADLSLVSFDEQPWTAILEPALTTVAQPVERIGAEAVRLILEAIAAKAAGTHLKVERVTLPVRLIERDSVVAPQR